MDAPVRQAIIVWVTVESDDPETQWCEIESPSTMPNGMVLAALDYARGLFQTTESSVDDE